MKIFTMPAIMTILLIAMTRNPYVATMTAYSLQSTLVDDAIYYLTIPLNSNIYYPYVNCNYISFNDCIDNNNNNNNSNNNTYIRILLY